MSFHDVNSWAFLTDGVDSINGDDATGPGIPPTGFLALDGTQIAASVAVTHTPSGDLQLKFNYQDSGGSGIFWQIGSGVGGNTLLFYCSGGNYGIGDALSAPTPFAASDTSLHAFDITYNSGTGDWTCIVDGGSPSVINVPITLPANAPTYWGGYFLGAGSQFATGNISNCEILSSAPVDTPVDLTSTAAITTSTTAKLTVGKDLTSTAAITTTTTAKLTVGKDLSSSAAITTSTTALLTVGKDLTSTAAITTSSTARLSVGTDLTSTAAITTSSTARLTVGKDLTSTFAITTSSTANITVLNDIPITLSCNFAITTSAVCTVPTQPVHYRCIAATIFKLQAMTIRGISPVNIVPLKLPLAHNFGNDPKPYKMPGIIVSPYGVDQMNPYEGTNRRDDVGYPVTISIIDVGNSNLELSQRQLKWKQQIARAFRNQAIDLTFIPEVYNVQVEPGLNYPIPSYLQQVDQLSMTLRFISREVRGVE